MGLGGGADLELCDRVDLPVSAADRVFVADVLGVEHRPAGDADVCFGVKVKALAPSPGKRLILIAYKTTREPRAMALGSDLAISFEDFKVPSVAIALVEAASVMRTGVGELGSGSSWANANAAIADNTKVIAVKRFAELAIQLYITVFLLRTEKELSSKRKAQGKRRR